MSTTGSLPHGTLVHTAHGLVQIQNITTDDDIITPKGKYKVTGVGSKGKSRMMRIETRYGYIECSPYHKIMTWDKVYKWKYARRVKKGVKLVHVFQNVPGTQTYINDICKQMTILNKDNAYLLGYLHGQIGSAIIDRESTKFKIMPLLDFFKPELFKFLVKITKDHIHILSKKFSIHISNIRNTGIIPDYIMQATQDLKQLYIDGVTHALKTVKRLCNLKYARQLQILYASLNVKTIVDDQSIMVIPEIPKTYVGQSLIEYFMPPPPVSHIEVTSIVLTNKHLKTYNIYVDNKGNNCIINSGNLVHG